jgi:hypothetical protein
MENDDFVENHSCDDWAEECKICMLGDSAKIQISQVGRIGMNVRGFTCL